ncbi:response regulator transcription factor [Parasphingopyxis marina]|uniref:Response regulator transcription factor n=1 Tax=Parasphingopyxis marina TaxID=2761622 RepID=A0A842HW80_9SPHN|nr:response regulator transcription factor [Parasphingopyxis marina]MBC2776529.1 response regulator transcription factor [Parasphingopyxis marina]
MVRTMLIYALALALAASALQWIEYKYLTRAFSGELYIVLIAIGFAALGMWAGNRLTRKTAPPPFAINEAALDALGISPRECEVLSQLSAGLSNKEIARALGISPNTVKTHVARLFEKLSVERRTQAIRKARSLALIP